MIRLFIVRVELVYLFTCKTHVIVDDVWMPLNKDINIHNSNINYILYGKMNVNKINYIYSQLNIIYIYIF